MRRGSGLGLSAIYLRLLPVINRCGDRQRLLVLGAWLKFEINHKKFSNLHGRFEFI